MINGAPAHPKLGETDHNDRYHNYGGIEPETSSAQNARKDDPRQDIRNGDRQVTS